jgi:hypothetical protein
MPVRGYSIPKYPTNQDVRLNPAILSAMPGRWNGKPAVCVALSLTLSTGLFACSSGAPNETSQSSAIQTTITTTPVLTTIPSTTRPTLAVPLFEHGDGRGFFGCVVVAPPVFLSEDEACQVIREEAATQGVHFNEAKSLAGSSFPSTDIYDYSGEGTAQTWAGMLELDGYDAALDIGFEFVSQSDLLAWNIKGGSPGGISETYDMKDTARRLSQSVANTAVFYDPCVDYSKEKYEESTQKSYRLDRLREQVRDFLSWLAAQQII